MAIKQVTQTRAAADVGLQRYMRQIFNYMTGGVALSGLVAYFTVTSPTLLNIALSSGWLFMIVWFGFGFFMHRIIFNLQPTAALGVFAAFSALTGFALSPIALAYAQTEIFTAFAIASIMFGGASLYGYASSKSLSGWGNFLMMGAWGLIGLVVVSLVGSLLGYQMSGLSLMISAIAVPLFAGMTAWETNQLKEMYYHMGGDNVAQSRTAIYGATSLYMNFVVMFLHLLNLLNAARGN